MLNFGLIGCGKHAEWAVVPAMRGMVECRLAAAADLSAERLEIVGDGVAGYTDYREMLAKERLDAVYVATPQEAHCAPVLTAIAAGCHVVCEKPMGADVDECRRMNDAAEAAGKVLAIDFENRYIPGYRQVREWIAAGHLGAVGAIHIDHLWDGHKVMGPLSERRKGFLNRVGCLDCGIHMLDMARFISGGGEWGDIRALGAWFGEEVTFPPHIAILARLAPGRLVTLNASFAYTAYIKERVQAHGMLVLGEKGIIALEAHEGEHVFRLVSETLSATCLLDEAGHDQVIPNLLRDFVIAAEGGTPSPSMATGIDGLQAQIATDAANADAVAQGDACRVRA